MSSGDARFVEIYERSYRHVYGYCRRRTTVDQVDDAVADTYLTVWRKIDQVPSGDDLLPGYTGWPIASCLTSTAALRVATGSGRD